MKKTSKIVEMEVMKRILAGELYASISAETGVPVSTIKKIKKRNYEAFESRIKSVENSIYEDMERMLKQSYRSLSNILDRDASGEITLSVRDLVSISSEMYKQTVINSTPRMPSFSTQKTIQKYQ